MQTYDFSTESYILTQSLQRICAQAEPIKSLNCSILLTGVIYVLAGPLCAFLLHIARCVFPQVMWQRCVGTPSRGCCFPAVQTTPSSCGTLEDAKAPPLNCKDTSKDPKPLDCSPIITTTILIFCLLYWNIFAHVVSVFYCLFALYSFIANVFLIM